MKISKQPHYFILVLLGFSLFFTSCKFLTPSVMLRTGPNYPYSQFDTTSTTQQRQYKISVNDQLSIALYSNGGSTLIDVVGGVNNNNNTMGGAYSTVPQITNNYQATTNGNANGIVYTVDFDGTVRIPIIGRAYLQGMTVREAQEYLEKQFAQFYNKPFINIKVLNRRVIIFNGLGNSTAVVPLLYENTTLFEAIAQSGGIEDQSKAYKIKLIRGDLRNPKVYLIDLSTLSGVTEADLTLQANDIIYVEPIQNYPERFLQRLSPYLTAFNSTLIAVAFIQGYLYPKDTNP